MNLVTMSWKRVLAGAGISLLLATSGGAQPQIDLPNVWIKAFSMDRFEQNIVSRFHGKTTGYAYAVYQNGVLRKSGGSGSAVVQSTFPPIEPQARAMTADTRGDLFSASKTLTAAATMRAIEILQARGEAVSISSPIEPYLPRNWERGPGVHAITFRHVLRHEAGLSGVAAGQDLYDHVRQSIENGADFAWFGDGKDNYCGCNFALLRVLVAHMIHGHPFLPGWTRPDDWTGHAFVDFVREQLLLPAGVDAAGAEWSGPQPYIRYYNFNNMNYSTRYEWAFPRHRWVGPGFFVLSVKEFAKVLDRLRAGQGVSPGSWQLMRDHSLGLWPGPGSGNLNHNGGPGDGRGGSGWMMFPNGVTAVAFHNSSGFVGDVVQLLNQAFVEAHVNPDLM